MAIITTLKSKKCNQFGQNKQSKTTINSHKSAECYKTNFKTCGRRKTKIHKNKNKSTMNYLLSKLFFKI